MNEDSQYKIIIKRNETTSFYEAKCLAYPDITGYGETQEQAIDNLVFILGFM